ncbi:hypothetical protein [Microbacterium marinilacus]|uniref:Uncharacterized protein n=1 Tax=Microbacterium marinilacus TaxID=415209 RepID=A0ABP7BPI8_9MICO|nr:hypothetical protein [Microbacterium marinilacus]MBY0689878.1 hypothetical protein [Microbacterium marinilacus]
MTEETTSAVRGQRVVRFRQWALSTYIGEDGEIASSRIEPEWRETVFRDDGGIRSRALVAEPFDGDGSEGAAEPGTVIFDETLEPGASAIRDFFVYPDPPTDPAEVGGYLAGTMGAESEPTLGQYFAETGGLLANRVISAEQEAALLAFLSEQPGLRVDGSTTDRLGRQGVVLRATDWRPGQYENILIVSPSDGAFLAAETIYIGHDRDDIASPSVVEYTAWERAR